MWLRPLATLTAICAALAGVTLPAHASEDYPERPINVVIGFAPGGPTDSIGRVVFKRMSEILNTPIVIDNRPGAGGNIGTQAVVRAKPDGYTLLYATASLPTAVALHKRDDLNPREHLDAAGCAVAVPMMLLAARRTGMDSAAEFYQSIKERPGHYFLGSSGTGSLDHLTAMEVAHRLDQDFQHVPYKGNGPALNDVAADTIDFMYSGAFNSAVPYIQSGQVKALAVAANKRVAALPDVPTLQESVPELKDFVAQTWQALLAPAGTPEPILSKIDAALQEALSDPEVQKSLNFQGAEPMGRSLQECQQFIEDETDRWSALITQLKLSVE